MVDPRGLNHPMAGEEQINGLEVGVYRASAVGYCEWALLAARMGMEPAAPPEAMQKVFSEGHDNEQVILDLFYAQNKYLTKIPPTIDSNGLSGSNRTCEVWIGNQIVIRGHVDDLAEHAPSQTYLLEAKAVGKSLWSEWIKAIAALPESDFVNGDKLFAEGGLLEGLWQKYRDQVEVYMAATGAVQCALIVGQKPERVEGEERGPVTNIEWVWVSPDIQRLARIKTKIAIVEGRSRGGVSLPSECPSQQYPCPYYYLMHPQKEKLKPIEIVDDELAQAMSDYQQAGKDEKSAEKKKAAAKQILDRFFGHGETKVLDEQLSDSVGESPSVVSIPAGQPVVSGQWTATYVERPQPAATIQRKAYTQKFYQVKATKKAGG